MIKNIAGVAFVVLCAFAAAAQDAAKPVADPWKPLRFLTGTWEAKTQGGSAGAAGSGTYTFQLELQGHVLARHAHTAGCQGPADFNCEHADILYIYPGNSAASYKAIYFDSEGHVIHYQVTTPEPNLAVFESDPAAPGPQFRLSYELKAFTMTGKFQLRMPGQTAYRSYLEWSGERK